MSTKETVDQYLARAGIIQTVEQGASGIVWPTSSTKRDTVGRLKSMDRARIRRNRSSWGKFLGSQGPT